jgi:hypothetical protein
MIKIFICNISKHIFNEEQLKKYLIKSDNYSYILSCDGIFKLHNDAIYKLKISDNNSEKKTINNVDLLLDKSYLIKKDTNHIPFTSYDLLDINVNIYGLRDNANLKLYIEKRGHKIYDVYFIANDKLDEYNLVDDINTFLTMLN